MRNFGETDVTKKERRIRLPENPANLSEEMLLSVRDAVKSSLHEGGLPCGSAFKIAQRLGVPKIAVGKMTDDLGVRVTNCQIGCFKVDKIGHDVVSGKQVDEAVFARLEALKELGDLTCANVHALASELKSTPMIIANVANARGLKVRNCQLGCF